MAWRPDVACGVKLFLIAGAVVFVPWVLDNAV
jgi:hypothetical protein